MHFMGYICDKLQSILTPSNKQHPIDLDYSNYNNNTININRAKNVRTKNIPTLDISNAIISLNNEDEEPPSYREIRTNGVNFYRNTMFSDTLIRRPHM